MLRTAPTSAHTRSYTSTFPYIFYSPDQEPSALQRAVLDGEATANIAADPHEHSAASTQFMAFLQSPSQHNRSVNDSDSGAASASTDSTAAPSAAVAEDMAAAAPEPDAEQISRQVGNTVPDQAHSIYEAIVAEGPEPLTSTGAEASAEQHAAQPRTDAAPPGDAQRIRKPGPPHTTNAPGVTALGTIDIETGRVVEESFSGPSQAAGGATYDVSTGGATVVNDQPIPQDSVPITADAARRFDDAQGEQTSVAPEADVRATQESTPLAYEQQKADAIAVESTEASDAAQPRVTQEHEGEPERVAQSMDAGSAAAVRLATLQQDVADPSADVADGSVEEASEPERKQGKVGEALRGAKVVRKMRDWKAMGAWLLKFDRAEHLFPTEISRMWTGVIQVRIRQSTLLCAGRCLLAVVLAVLLAANIAHAA